MQLSQTDIKLLLESNERFLGLLHIINNVIPQPWCIFGGQLRNIVWDTVNESPFPHSSTDIDVGVFAPNQPLIEEELRDLLKAKDSSLDWDIENFAFSHIENGDAPYTSLEDALRKQLMTVMSVGATIDEQGAIALIAPLGIEDIAACIVRPTPIIFDHPERKRLIEERIIAKQWRQKWPKLQTIL